MILDSNDASMQRDVNWSVVLSSPATVPTLLNTTAVNGDDTLTPASITGTGPYTVEFAVGDLSKQVDATGYPWDITVDAETVTTGNIPLNIQAGYTLVDLVDPITTNGSILFGATGGTVATSDHAEYDVTSTLDSGVTFNVAANGVWTITEATDGDWTTDIVITRRVVITSGVIGQEAILILNAATQTVILVPIGSEQEKAIAFYRSVTGSSSYNLNDLAVAYYRQVGSTAGYSYNDGLRAAQDAVPFVGQSPTDWRNNV